MAADRRQADWEAIEREYRAGQLSVREIARKHDASEANIRKRASAGGWQRTLAEKVRNAVREGLVRSAQPSAHPLRDEEVVRTHAEVGVEVVRQHRSDIARGRNLTLRLMAELDTVTTHRDELAEMIETETVGDKTVQRRNAMMRAIELPSRAGVIKDLSTAAKNWIALERQAFNLDDDGASEDRLQIVIASGDAEL